MDFLKVLNLNEQKVVLVCAYLRKKGTIFDGNKFKVILSKKYRQHFSFTPAFPKKSYGQNLPTILALFAYAKFRWKWLILTIPNSVIGIQLFLLKKGFFPYKF